MSFGGFGAPAFGAASTPAFGSTAASAPAFGAAASSAPFGASSAPAFGSTNAPASTPSLFGSTSTPAFGASSAPAFGSTTGTPSLFGAPASSSAPAFGAPASSGSSLFGSSSQPSLFGGASQPSLFGQASAAPASTPSLFGGTSAPSLFGASAAPASNALALPGQQQQQQQQQQQLITYNTKYDDLPANMQQELLAIQREISNYREDCEKMDRDPRLHDSVALKRSMEEETSGLKQILQGMANSVKADDDQLGDFREKVMQLLRSTESAVRTFQRSKLWRDAPQQYKGQIVPPQVQELLASPVVLPSPYLEQAVLGFQDTLATYRQVVGELEQVLPADPSALASMDESHALQALPITISYMHDYFVHVAAQMEQLHNMVSRSKDAFLAQRQASGDMTNPFRRAQNTSSSGPSKAVGLPPASTHSSTHQHQLQQPQPGASPSPFQMPALPAPGQFGTPGMAAAPAPFGTPTPLDASGQAAAGSGGARTGRRQRR